MSKAKDYSAIANNIQDLYNEVCTLAKRLDDVKDTLNSHYPLDKLNSIIQRIYEIEKSVNSNKDCMETLKQYQANINDMSKQIETIQQKDKMAKHFMRLSNISLASELIFILFLGYCAWQLLFPKTNIEDPIYSITMLTAGIIVLVIIALLLLYFTKKNKTSLF